MRNRNSAFVPGAGDINLTGSFAITGSMTLTGSLNVIGSSQFTGSSSISGSLTVQDCPVAGQLKLGELPTSDITNACGMQLTSSAAQGTVAVWGCRIDGANNKSVLLVADVNKDTIDDDHKLLSIGSIDKSRAYQEVLRLVGTETLEWETSGSAEVLGTDTDGATAVGTIIGSDDDYTTDGAHIVEEVSGTETRAYTDWLGRKAWGITSKGGYATDWVLTEVLSVASGTAYTDSSIQIPIGAVNYGVGVCTLSAFPTASTYAIGISASVGGFSEKWGSLSSVAGSRNTTTSMKAGFEYYSASTAIRLSSSVWQGATAVPTGSVRVEIRYRTVNPPTA